MVTSAEAEMKVLKYLRDKTKGDVDSINILNLRTEAVVKGTGLPLRYAQEALNSLAGIPRGTFDTGKEQRIERIICRFDFWLPVDCAEFKHKLYYSDVTRYNSGLVAFFISLLGLALIIWMAKLENLPAYTAFYMLGVVVMLVSLPLASSINHRFYKINFRLQNIPNYRWYVFVFIISTTFSIIVAIIGAQSTLSKNILLVIGILSSISTIAAAMYQLHKY